MRLAPKRCAACPVLVCALLRFPVRLAPFYATGNDWILAAHNYPLSVTYGNYLRRAVLVFFILSWLMAVGLLMRNRFLSCDPEIRRQTGIVIWGMVLGFGPFLAFTLLPYILFGQEYLAGSYTILFMMTLPLAYAYVIFQRKLLKVDFIINRIVV